MTAIVGRSSAGKTTLVSLLPRFYDPTDGVITLDGVDLMEHSLEWLRGQIGIVMQRSSFFGGTVAEEIALGQPELTLGAIRDAAEKAHIRDFIERLPARYETVLRECAVNL